MNPKPHTHEYGDSDEAESNEHEYLGGHGMNDAQMKAMFAKNRQAGPGKAGIAKPGRLADPNKKLGGERANLMTMVRSKPHTPDMARKTTPTKQFDGRSARPKASPKVTDGTKAGKAAKPAATPKSHAPKSGKSHSGDHDKGGHQGGAAHSPLGVLKKIGGAVKEAGREAVKATVAGTGNETVAGEMHKSLKGHKFGDPSDGRHEDR